MGSNSDHYQTLGILHTANKKEMREAYHRLAKKFHPDLNKGNKEAELKFKQINAAYETLRDDRRRMAYNAQMDAFADTSEAIRKSTKEASAHKAKQRSRLRDTLAFDDLLRHLFAILLFGITLFLLFDHWLLDPFFIVPFGVLVAWLIHQYHDDISYSISVFSPRHVLMGWLFVLMIVIESVYSPYHHNLIQLYGGYSRTGIIMMPFHLVFFLYYALIESPWAEVLKTELGIWVVSLFIAKARFSSWFLFGWLFLVTIITKYDAKLMADFSVYYNLFTIDPIRGHV